VHEKRNDVQTVKQVAKENICNQSY
jgi:hypothetical protein